MSNALRARVKYALIGTARAEKTFGLIGCNPNEYKAYLESLFDDKMSWDNYGEYWEVDHIKPVASFDLTKPEEQRKAFHFQNTRPLEKWKNRKKRDKILENEEEFFKSL